MGTKDKDKLKRMNVQ